MPFALLYTFAPVMLIVAAIRAKSANDRDRRSAPGRMSYFWGYFLGNAAILSSVLVLFFAVPMWGGRPGGAAAAWLGAATAWAVAMLLAGVLTLNRSRAGLIAATLLTGFPPAWIGYGVFLRRRWRELSGAAPPG